MISISVIDDTNMQLATTVTGGWQPSRTVTVLNNVQTCVACFDSVDESDLKHADYKSIALHTPPSALSRANAQGIVQELRSWQICEVGSGTRWEYFGLKPDLITRIPLVCQVLCFDSLSTNIRLLKMLRRVICQRQKEQQAAEPAQTHVLTSFCLWNPPTCIGKEDFAVPPGWILVIHRTFEAICLSLRTSGHSLEVPCSAVIIESFEHIPVQAMPAAHMTWRDDRNKICNMISQDTQPHKGHNRFCWHRALMKWDKR